MTYITPEELGPALPSRTDEDEARERRLTALLAVAGLAAREMLPPGPELRDRFRELVTRDPVDSLITTVLAGGLLFYLAERDSNPRCATYWDAVLYVATSLSVGFDDVTPKTPAGNALAAAVHTFGPSMAAAALSPPAKSSVAGAAPVDEQLLEVNKAILARLDEIARALAAPR